MECYTCPPPPPRSTLRHYSPSQTRPSLGSKPHHTASPSHHARQRSPAPRQKLTSRATTAAPPQTAAASPRRPSNTPAAPTTEPVRVPRCLYHVAFSRRELGICDCHFSTVVSMTKSCSVCKASLLAPPLALGGASIDVIAVSWCVRCLSTSQQCTADLNKLYGGWRSRLPAHVACVQSNFIRCIR